MKTPMKKRISNNTYHLPGASSNLQEPVWGPWEWIVVGFGSFIAVEGRKAADDRGYMNDEFVTCWSKLNGLFLFWVPHKEPPPAASGSESTSALQPWLQWQQNHKTRETFATVGSQGDVHMLD
jgi:hypothetical protein